MSVDAYAALGIAYGLTPEQADSVYDYVYRNPVPGSPSEAIADFQAAARALGYPPPLPLPRLDVEAERERMDSMRGELASLRESVNGIVR